MIDLTDLETEEGFEDDHILDLACSMVREDRPQITMKNAQTTTVGEQMAYTHA